MTFVISDQTSETNVKTCFLALPGFVSCSFNPCRLAGQWNEEGGHLRGRTDESIAAALCWWWELK